METTPYANDPEEDIGRLTEYELLSTPPVQLPFMPRVLAETTLPIGLDIVTPEYLDTEISAALGVEARVAVTFPLVVGFPTPFQTSTFV